MEKNSEAITDFVLDLITGGKLKKGDKLPTERKMAEDMRVSRSSVREALKGLEAMGIVTSVQGSGSYITDTPELSINKPLCALFALGNGTLESVLQLRCVFETAACKDIIMNASDEQIQEICRLAEYDYTQSPASNQAVRDSKFHCAIVNLSENVLLKYIYATLSTLMDIYREQVLEETYKQDENALTEQGHKEICRALTERDSIAAEKAVEEHLKLSEQYIEMLTKRF